jgi:hypothetical protein
MNTDTNNYKDIGELCVELERQKDRLHEALEIANMFADERDELEAEVERLKGALIECLKITSIYDSNGDYETALDNVYDIAANALKTQDNK